MLYGFVMMMCYDRFISKNQDKFLDVNHYISSEEALQYAETADPISRATITADDVKGMEAPESDKENGEKKGRGRKRKVEEQEQEEENESSLQVKEESEEATEVPEKRTRGRKSSPRKARKSDEENEEPEAEETSSPGRYSMRGSRRATSRYE